MTLPRILHIERSLAILVLVACTGCFVATAMVLFGHYPAVFNQSLRTGYLLNVGLLVVLPTVMGTLAVALLRPKAAWLLRPVLLGCTVLIALEVLLFGFDKTTISVEGSVLPTASYNVKQENGVIYLGHATATSPFGFRSPRIEPKTSHGKRILFLGNSYVEGSGTTFATNYPQAVEAELRRMFPGQDITVFSAGVRGYGIEDDRLVYSYLRGQGYHFDMVVLNFMMGSDPTNDVPQTIRMSMAGQAQRLHENRFLRMFYPLDTYLFRYLIYLDVTFHSNFGGPEPDPETKGAPCQQTPGFMSFASERTQFYYGPGAQQRIDMAATDREIDALDRDATKNGAPFLLVMMPDQYSMLARNRDRFAGTPMDWQWIRKDLLSTAQGKFPVVDLTDTFVDQPESYHCNDAHWTDEGNMLAADALARPLAKLLVEDRLATVHNE